jgi:nitric oxide reductase NorD protein
VVQDERKNGMLMIFRAESLFTWDEYVKVNRHTDEDDDDNAAAAAEDMNRLSLAQDAHTKGGKLKFDLDLPAAAWDDTPLGAGLMLPEWNWKQQRLVEDHCRLLPMLPRDAAGLPTACCRWPAACAASFRRWHRNARARADRNAGRTSISTASSAFWPNATVASPRPNPACIRPGHRASAAWPA